jgi:hypothetical protein
MIALPETIALGFGYMKDKNFFELNVATLEV